MAKVVEYREIPLDEMVIGKGQVRTQNTGQEIDELARSIEIQGLLQPIVVCQAREEGRWEILTGQRRFLAHKHLGREKITAAVLDERVNEGQAKAISITENLIRRQLTGKELKDGVNVLYNFYGTVKEVVETTGLPRSKVSEYIKYPRLIKDLKSLVDEGVVDVNVAVKAQDAASDDEGVADPEVAVQLAKEMAQMTGVQRKKVHKEIKDHPRPDIDEVIERAKTGSKVVQVLATVTQDVHAAIQQVAKEEDANQDDAVALLIEEALIDRGALKGS
ncbi:MAG: ParB/RepB/Spo0J family partition protein [Gammaproteobacteria bacterium]|nr:ParB/RepB/Spo0J family partition protein [Gammaproteobacteria bacterium]